MKVFNESFDNGAITPSQQISILTLIHKKGDKFKLLTYRPICLTNRDYRILASALANRQHQILHIMISTDQSGYVKGSFIGHNIRIVEDIIYYTNITSNDSVITMLDFEKAFDYIEWDFIFEVQKNTDCFTVISY